MTVCFSWVVSSAKKEDTDEEIAKYDGRCGDQLMLDEAICPPGRDVDHCVLSRSGKWAVEEMKDSKLPGDKGLVLKSRAKHHAISAQLLRPFTFDTRPLVVQ